MIARPTRWIAAAILLSVATCVALAVNATPPTLGPLSVTTAQVGAPFSATIQATGTPDYEYSLTAGSLPPGLSISPDPTTQTSGPVTISGTPTTAGTYPFTVSVSDGVPAPAPASPAKDSAGRRHGLAQSGNNAVGTTAVNYSITVGGSAAAGAPTSPWTLALVMAGLAGAGFWRLRQTRHA